MGKPGLQPLENLPSMPVSATFLNSNETSERINV